jgi:hypothetical protein
MYSGMKRTPSKLFESSTKKIKRFDDRDFNDRPSEKIDLNDEEMHSN